MANSLLPYSSYHIFGLKQEAVFCHRHRKLKLLLWIAFTIFTHFQVKFWSTRWFILLHINSCRIHASADILCSWCGMCFMCFEWCSDFGCLTVFLFLGYFLPSSKLCVYSVPLWKSIYTCRVWMVNCGTKIRF